MKNRREAIRGALAAGVVTFIGARGVAAPGIQKEEKVDYQRDRQNILAAGLTEKEADCWEQAAKCAAAFFELPELHPMDQQEVATAIHVIQNKLLSRPTYRKYRSATRG